MEIFEIFVNTQRYTVYSDEWEGGIHQVKSADGNNRLLRLKTDRSWEELHPATLDPINIAEDQELQLLGNEIEEKLLSYSPEMLRNAG